MIIYNFRKECVMNTELLMKEFENLLEEKNYNYCDPQVIELGLKLEKQLFKNHNGKDC